jgi:hypothetical protein
VADARESLKRAVCKREPYVMLWQKQERAFTRDLFFMQVLSGTGNGVEGVAVSEKRVWIPEWKRCITVKKVVEGEKYKITWYENRGQPHWKERIVFRAEAQPRGLFVELRGRGAAKGLIR